MSEVVNKYREPREEIVHLDESRTLPVAPVIGHKGETGISTFTRRFSRRYGYDGASINEGGTARAQAFFVLRLSEDRRAFFINPFSRGITIF